MLMAERLKAQFARIGLFSVAQDALDKLDIGGHCSFFGSSRELGPGVVFGATNEIRKAWLVARDIAIALGTVGHVTMLRRTQAGPFDLSQSISLDKLADLAKARLLDGAVLPLIAGLDDIPALPVTPEEAKLLRFGQKLDRTLATPGLVLATDAGRPVALVEAGTDGLTVVRGFNI